MLVVVNIDKKNKRALHRKDTWLKMVSGALQNTKNDVKLGCIGKNGYGGNGMQSKGFNTERYVFYTADKGHFAPFCAILQKR